MQSWEEVLLLDWENQGSFFSDPCLGFLQSCMLRLVLNWFSIFRQLDEKHKPGLKLKIGCPGPGVSRQAKRSASPSNPSHGFCDFNGGGGGGEPRGFVRIG